MIMRSDLYFTSETSGRSKTFLTGRKCVRACERVAVFGEMFNFSCEVQGGTIWCYLLLTFSIVTNRLNGPGQVSLCLG